MEIKPPAKNDTGNHEEANVNVMKFKKKVQKAENLRNYDFGGNKKWKPIMAGMVGHPNTYVKYA